MGARVERLGHTGDMSSQDAASLPSRWAGADEAMPLSLDELAGPDHGVVMLPVDLAWSGRRSFDLADPDQRYLCYMTVLTAGVTREHYTRWLNADLLRAQWSRLRLPRPLRRQWQDHFPELRTSVARPA